jgi:hypothetical protein
MNETVIAAIAALAASVYLLLKKEARIWAIVATVAAGVLVAVSFGWLQMSIPGLGLDLGLVGGAVLAVAGVFLFLKVSEKFRVASATIVVITGALLVFAFLL